MSAAPSSQLAVYAVPVQVRAGSSAPGRHALGQHLQRLLVLRVGQVAKRPRPLEQRQHLRFVLLLGGAQGDDLLRGDVQRHLGDVLAVQLTGGGGSQQRGALDQLVASHGKQATARHRCGIGPVVGAPHPLQERTDRARRAHLTHQIDGADIDAQL